MNPDYIRRQTVFHINWKDKKGYCQQNIQCKGGDV